MLTESDMSLNVLFRPFGSSYTWILEIFHFLKLILTFRHMWQICIFLSRYFMALSGFQFYPIYQKWRKLCKTLWGISYAMDNSKVCDQIGNLNIWSGKYNTIVSYGLCSTRKNRIPPWGIKIYFTCREPWTDREPWLSKGSHECKKPWELVLC